MKYVRKVPKTVLEDREVELCDGCYRDIHPYPGNHMSKVFTLAYSSKLSSTEGSLVFCITCYKKLLEPFFRSLRELRTENGGKPR